MSDLILHTAVRFRVARVSLKQSLTNGMRLAVERVRREQTGQDMVEYAGVLLVVAIIIAAVAASGLGGTIVGDLKGVISNITSGTCPKNQKC